MPRLQAGPGLSLAEVQLLHLGIGAALQHVQDDVAAALGDQVVAGLERSLELAAVLVSDALADPGPQCPVSSEGDGYGYRCVGRAGQPHDHIDSAGNQLAATPEPEQLP